MPTSVACPKCGQAFQVPPELLSRRLRCLQCQHVFAAQAGPPPDATVPLALSPEEGPSPSRGGVRRAREDHGVPGYLWPPAVLPWGLLLLALGGCVWGLLAGLAAAALGAAGVALVRARRWPVGVRLAGLLALDGVAGLLMIGGGVLVFRLWASPGGEPTQVAVPHGLTRAGQGGTPVNGPVRSGPKGTPGDAPSLPPAPDVPLPPVRPLFTNGPGAFLADLPEFGAQAGPPWPFGKNGQVGDGRPIRVNGFRSPKGLSMHPPWAPGFASVRYRLGKQAAVFRAVVAINETTSWCWSPATFTVLGDGKTLWQSAWIAHNYAHSQTCSADVSGVDVLELRVHCVNGSDGVHAVWVEPRVLQKADTPDE
jgi:hypothetical protein